MLTPNDMAGLEGKELYGANNERLGKIAAVFESVEADQATFVTIHTGAFGKAHHFVPLDGGSLQPDGVLVPYPKQLVHDAPSVQDDEELTPEEEQRLYAHYGIVGDTGVQQEEGVSPAGQDTSGPNTDDAMTRSEEQLHVGTEQVEAGRARLRKHVVTEQQQVTVPVWHEEVRVEREPITEGNADAAHDGLAITEGEHELVLKAERPVVAKEAVPVERVKLGTETVTEQDTVTEQVRKEQIDTDGV